jgi:hypothetical protein
MKFFFALLAMVMLPAYASVIQLETGSYEVRPVDRYGNVQVCTFEIQNVQTEGMLVLNVNDCPPVISDVRLFNYEGDAFYISQKVTAETSSREGYKMYEIHPMSSTQFKMVTYREYANGQVDKPRSIIAKKR